MKKTVCLLLTIILIISFLFSFMACKKDVEIFDDLVSKRGDIVENLSAYELASTAYNNWKNNVFPNHKRIEELNFSVNEGSLATRHARQIYKVDGDKMWSEQVTINTGLAGTNYAVKLLFKENTGYAWVLKGGKSVKGQKPNIYAIKDWGEPTTYTLENDADVIAEYKNQYKKMITTYNLDSKEYLDDTHDDSVYYYELDKTKYICTVTIDMSLNAQKTVQQKAKEEFENALGAKKDSIDMQPVTITFLIEKVDDTYRVLQWSSLEVYTGYKLGTKSCAQTYKAVFSYLEEDYKIED